MDWTIAIAGFATAAGWDEERIARHFTIVPYSIPRSCAATYFPEANVLVPVRHFADKSHTPASKSVVISIRPSDDGTIDKSAS